jgi:hypothetical protein
MTLNFPNAPTNGQIYEGYQYNTAKGVWVTPGFSQVEASTTHLGIVALATPAETITSTIPNKAVTPAGLATFSQGGHTHTNAELVEQSIAPLSGDAGPDSYPLGVSIFSVPANGTWPNHLATCVTARVGGQRTTQEVTTKGNNRWTRAEVTANTWTDWTYTPAALARPAFQARLPANQTNSGTASSVLVNFTFEVFDQGDNLSGGRFTAPVSGLYQFAASFATSTSTGGPEINVFKNGSSFYSNIAIGYSGPWHTFGTTILMELNAGDIVDMRVNNNNGATITLAANRCWFSGYFIG